VWLLLRLLWVKLGLQRCVHDGAEVRPNSIESIAAQLLRDTAACTWPLAPLVVARKGVYTDLAKWAKRAAYAPARRWRVCPHRPWPRLDRSRSTRSSCAIGDLVIAPAHEEELRTLLRAPLEGGKRRECTAGATRRAGRGDGRRC